MAEITQITNESELDAALSEIDNLIHADPGSAEELELNRISDLVIKYEDIHYPIADPDPKSMVEFMLDQEMVTRNQLVALLDSDSQLDDILSGHINIPLDLAQLLHEKSNLPVDYFIDLGG